MAGDGDRPDARQITGGDHRSDRDPLGTDGRTEGGIFDIDAVEQVACPGQDHGAHRKRRVVGISAWQQGAGTIKQRQRVEVGCTGSWLLGQVRTPWSLARSSVWASAICRTANTRATRRPVTCSTWNSMQSTTTDSPSDGTRPNDATTRPPTVSQSSSGRATPNTSARPS